VSKLDERTVSIWIQDLLESFAGTVGGGAVDVDVLVVNVAESSFLLRVPSSCLIAVQSVLVLAQEFNGKACAVEMVGCSTCLAAMANAKRDMSMSDFSRDAME